MNSYDQVPYPDWIHCNTHPRQLETVATLFGMQPTPITSCRTLEIGCAGGWNLMSIAQSLTASTFVGFDTSEQQIARALDLARKAGVDNVRFEQADILSVDKSWGEFDYIICHGIYSWVPANTRKKILAICKDNLAANGVALVSYNVYPGCHFRQMIRDMMLFHVQESNDPAEKTAQARAVLDFMLRQSPQEGAYATVLKDELANIEGVEDAQLFHDYLEQINDPIYFHQFVAQSEAAGLQYLGDVQLPSMLAELLPKSAQDAFRGLSLVQQEQYMDFLHNRAFRSSLICHDDVELSRNLNASLMQRFHFAASAPMSADQIDVQQDKRIDIKLGKVRISTGDVATKAALKYLASRWPDAVSFQDVLCAVHSELNSNVELSMTDVAKESICSALLMMTASGILHAWIHPPNQRVSRGEKPLASRLARIQALHGNSVSTDSHQQIRLNDTEQRLIRLLDASHSEEQLISYLRSAFAEGEMLIKERGDAMKEVSDAQLSAIVEQTLERLHTAGLLVA